ncbi:MAG: insulinase family protein, partial [Prevotella sp.]|nr:insulinase family protein [Prevotella sp.]
QSKDYETVEGDLMETRIYTLDNGLKVYLSVNEETPRIQTYIAVRTGSRNDPAETTGLAHYLEHIMFKGSKHFGTCDYEKEKPLLDDIERRFEEYRVTTDPELRKQMYHGIDSVSQLAAQYFIPNEYDKLMAAIGAQGTNAYTSNDVTCYVEDIPSNEIENWLKIEADRFKNMVIRGFHTELEAVYEEKNMSLTQDNRKAIEALLAQLFPTHPYGTQTTLGTQEHLKNPSITNIKNYFNRYYVPNNVAICMAGDFNPDEVIELIKKYFGDWQPNKELSRPEFDPQPEITAIKDTSVVGLEAECMLMGWRFNGANDPQVDTLDVLTEVLANGKAGLFDINLEQQMKARSVSAFTYSFTDYTALIFYAFPKNNQTLEELRALIIEELGKLKNGEFSDELVQSVINNKKRAYYESLITNKSRADMFVDAFINGLEWKDVVGKIGRMEKITKQQLVDFANKHLNDNFVCVYKRQGEDTSIKKVEKPAITPIPSNRDNASDFLKEIQASKTEPIKPRFVDFEKDMTKAEMSNGLPVLYKKNTTDGLFNLSFVYDYGTENVRGLDLVADYLNYIGTDKRTSAEIKQELYKLACNYNISIGDNRTTISLSGLQENMEQALALLEDIIGNAKGDKESYDKLVGMLIKAREDAKSSQRSSFNALRQYAIYGPYNSQRNTLSEKELRAGTPDMLTDMLKPFGELKHTIMYFGPMDVEPFKELIAKEHKMADEPKEAVAEKKYTKLETPENEIVIAPYDAKNIYLMQLHNENKQWTPESEPVVTLFNEYFGGGMNTIVFQELREARGLAYSASSFYNTPSKKDDPEWYYTMIISQNDKMMDCISVFNEILDEMPQSENAFNVAKQSLTKSLESRRTTRFAVLTKYLSNQYLGIDYDINEKIYNALPSLTLQSIVDFEKQNMAKKPYRYIILGNEKELDIKSLEKIGKIKRLSTEEIFGY